MIYLGILIGIAATLAVAKYLAWLHVTKVRK
jgi:hypothetical protein